MQQRRLRVALVGCGQVADAHLQEIRKIPGAELVAVCDRYLDLANQAAARFGVAGVFDDLDRMLATVQPDVLHVTTPPQTHKAIALCAFDAHAHVYLEKPFAIDLDETKEILAAAKRADRLVCVGHDQLFDPIWEEFRGVLARGELGEVVHIDSILGYDLTGPFGAVLASEPDHWVHKLPGGLFQNTISHALYKITDLMDDAAPRIWASWFGYKEAAAFPTELRVVLQGERITAALIFTCAARPLQRVVRVYGTKKTTEIDFDARLMRQYHKCSLPGALGKLETPARELREAARSLFRNALRFARSDLHYFAGMNRLFRSLYKAIDVGGEPPIPYREIERVTALMDAIFRECQGTPKPQVEMPTDDKLENGKQARRSETRPEERAVQ